MDTSTPLMRVHNLTHAFGRVLACADVSFELHSGEVLGVVGESGSGKTTLLNCISARLAPTNGIVEYDLRGRGLTDIYALSEPERRLLLRTDWGVVMQNPRDGLRMDVSAGGNVGERLMAVGARHYFSGGMQQRLQIARNLVTKPRLVFMDEPTGGLDVSVQARLLDLLRGLVRELRLSAIIVTHDLAVARLLADRLMVMKDGRVVETGLTDQVLDDPHHPYTQLLVSSVLQV